MKVLLFGSVFVVVLCVGCILMVSVSSWVSLFSGSRVWLLFW